MLKSKRILVLDDRNDSRGLLSATLRRKLPDAVLIECSSFGEAVDNLMSQPVDLLVVHRLAETDCPTLVESFRSMGSVVPIVAVCSSTEREAVVAAGASGIISLDEWLVLGDAVENAWKPMT